MRETIKIKGRYLWLPIKRDVTDTAIAFFDGERKIQELYVGITEGEPDFYAWFDAGSFLEKDLVLEGDFKKEWFDRVRVSDEKPRNPTKNRPLLHYAPQFGWMNDPNGLICCDETYHIYHQHNPYGVTWENIHWAHTRTKDFIHFTQTEDVLFPDEEGPVFSGTAVLDKHNSLGMGKEAAAFFYTSAGGRSRWSSGHSFTQKIAVSRDGGETLVKFKDFTLPHMEEENRDPKVFYHEETNSYIMILFISGHTFYFFRSADLLCWEKIQELTVPGMWECPDFFHLKCEGDGTGKWVLWSADGYYCLGDFDGRGFYPERETKEGPVKQQAMYEMILDEENKADRGTVRAYAAQTFQGTAGRVLQLSWITSTKKDKNYAGILSLPAELSLRSIGGEYRICMNPAAEMEKFRKETHEFLLKETADRLPILEKCLYEGSGHPIELEIHIAEESRRDGYLKLSIFHNALEIRMNGNELKIGPHKIGLLKERDSCIRLYADTDVLELFASGGLKYAVADNAGDSLNGTVDLTSSGITGSIRLHVLETIGFEEENL
ncbi:glycoside hydrolase family 32 protein [Lachnospiraceae bacterium 54-53]